MSALAKKLPVEGTVTLQTSQNNNLPVPVLAEQSENRVGAGNNQVPSTDEARESTSKTSRYRRGTTRGGQNLYNRKILGKPEPLSAAIRVRQKAP